MGKTKKATSSSKAPGDEGCKKTWKRSAAIITDKINCGECENFFKKERSVGMCLKRSQVVERTAAATGVSVRSVRNIHKEFQLQDGTLLAPVKRYAASRVHVNPDAFDEEVIRRVVLTFYARKEYTTLSTVLEKLKEECSFPGGRYCLWRVLCDMGFSYKTKDGKQFVYERADILVQRHTYLKQILKYRRQNKTLIYMDETCTSYKPVYMG